MTNIVLFIVGPWLLNAGWKLGEKQARSNERLMYWNRSNQASGQSLLLNRIAEKLSGRPESQAKERLAGTTVSALKRIVNSSAFEHLVRGLFREKSLIRKILK